MHEVNDIVLYYIRHTSLHFGRCNFIFQLLLRKAFKYFNDGFVVRAKKVNVKITNLVCLKQFMDIRNAVCMTSFPLIYLKKNILAMLILIWPLFQTQILDHEFVEKTASFTFCAIYFDRGYKLFKERIKKFK